MTAYEFDKNRHAVYSLNYHFICVVKYRRQIFDSDTIIDELKSRTLKLAPKYDITITNMETDKDHIHILFSCKPQTNIIKFINNWKSSTAKALRNRFPQINEKLWGKVFWNDSYCLITTGQVTIDILKKYIDNQGKK